MVFRCVILENPQVLKPLASLKIKGGVFNLLGLSQFDIIFRRTDSLEAFGKMRKSTDDHNPFQAIVLAEVSALSVQPVSDSQAPVARVHEHFVAVQPGCLWVVSRTVTAPRALLPGMLAERAMLRNPKGSAVSHDLVLVDGHEDAFGEVVDLTT